MEAGKFYGSSGVAVKSVKATTESLSVELAPDEDTMFVVEFIGTLKQDLPAKDAIKGTNREWNESIGRVLARGEISAGKLTYNFTGDEVYVRARVTSSKKHPNPSDVGEFERAWVQPVVGPAAMKLED